MSLDVLVVLCLADVGQPRVQANSDSRQHCSGDLLLLERNQEREFLMDMNPEHDLELHVGAEVYWNDPDDGVCSGFYEIVEFRNDIYVLLKNEAGSETEVFIHELS